MRQWIKPSESLPESRSMVRVITTGGEEFLGEFDKVSREFIDRVSDLGRMAIDDVELWSWANSIPTASAGLRLVNAA